MNIERSKICIGSDIRSLLFSYFNDYYFIPYQYFYSIPCEYYENIDFLFDIESNVRRKLEKTINIDGVSKNIYLKSDIEDFLFNFLGLNGKILSIGVDFYEFSGLDIVKIKNKHLKFNVEIKFDDCVMIDPLEIDDFLFFEYDLVEESKNNVYMFYKLKNNETFYRNYEKYNHISTFDKIFPQKIFYGDYKNQDFKYCVLFGIVDDKYINNDILFHEDRLLEFSIQNLIGEKDFKKNIGREKQYAGFVKKCIIPFPRKKYLDTNNIKFLYNSEQQIIKDYVSTTKNI